MSPVGIVTLMDQAPQQPTYRLEETVWETEEGKAVPALHPEAAFLVGIPGHKIPHTKAIALGLIQPDPAEALEEEITLEELENMTVEELKDLARENDLAVSGSKADLIKRLSEPEQNKMRAAGEDKGG